MAKSVSILLLAVLVVAVSLDAAHRVTAAISGASVRQAFKDFDTVGATEVLKQVKGVVKAATQVIKAATHDDDDGKERSAQGSGSTELILNNRFPQLAYVGVTDIKVGNIPTLSTGSSMLDINSDGSGGVLVSSNFPLTFLNTKAYQQLKTKITTGRAANSDLGVVDQPCYAGATPQPITLVFAGGDEMKVEADECWYKQSDGSICLAILPSPWTTGETIIGTMMQTGVEYDLTKGTMTFTSTKDGTGSGTSSKSNMAAAMKPFLGVWVLLLLLLVMILA